MSEQTPGDFVPPSPATPPTPPPAAMPVPPPPAYPTYAEQPPPPQQPAQPAPPTYAQQPYGQPYAQPYAQPYSQPGYGGYPGYTGYNPDGSVAVHQRPGSVTAAFVMSWVMMAVTAIGLVILLVVAAGDDKDIYGDVEDLGISAHDLRAVLVGMSIGLLAWTALALLFSIFAFRRQNWGRIALTVSAGLSVPVQFIGAGAIIPLIFAIGTIAVIVMLYVGDANAWYRTPEPVPGLTPSPGATFYQ